MLKHWLEAQIQHNRNYESCLVHSCFVLQTQQATSSYSKLGLTPKALSASWWLWKQEKVPLILGVIQTSNLWMKPNYEQNFWKWKVSIALQLFIWKWIKLSSFQQYSVIMMFSDFTKKYFTIFSSMLQGKIILNICTRVREWSHQYGMEFQVQEEIEKCLMFPL